MNLSILRTYSQPVQAGEQSTLGNAEAAAVQSRSTQSAGMDSFEHEARPAAEEAYTAAVYTNSGKPSAAEKILPEEYYIQLSRPRIGYQGSTVSYAELVEEAVSTGQMRLDENQSVWSNLERAEQILIWDKVKPLFPWSTTSYTEDGQYVCRIEDGRVTGARRAFYYDENGRKITAQYLAEQLASGIHPTDLDGSYSFLHDVDPELYFKSLEIGSARNRLQQALDDFETGKIPEKKLEEEIEPLLLLLFGRAGTKLTWAQLRHLLSAEDFGPNMLQTLGTLPSTGLSSPAAAT